MSSSEKEKRVRAMNNIIRPDQVMKSLCCSRSMVYKLIQKGELEAFKVGSAWRIYAYSVENYKKTSHSKHI